MALELTPGDTKHAIASIKRFCGEQLEFDVSDLQGMLLLDYILKEIAPSAYNAGVADAQTYLRDRVADLEGTCHAPEFSYWPKGSAVRRR